MCRHRANRSGSLSMVLVSQGNVQIPRQGFPCEKCGALLDTSGSRPIFDDKGRLVKIPDKLQKTKL